MDISIELHRSGIPQPKVLLDGKDITKAVLADGFAIDVTNLKQPTVSMVLRPDRLTVSGDLLADITERSLEELADASTTGTPQAKED